MTRSNVDTRALLAGLIPVVLLASLAPAAVGAEKSRPTVNFITDSPQQKDEGNRPFDGDKYKAQKGDKAYAKLLQQVDRAGAGMFTPDGDGIKDPDGRLLTEQQVEDLAAIGAVLETRDGGEIAGAKEAASLCKNAERVQELLWPGATAQERGENIEGLVHRVSSPDSAGIHRASLAASAGRMSRRLAGDEGERLHDALSGSQPAAAGVSVVRVAGGVGAAGGAAAGLAEAAEAARRMPRVTSPIKLRTTEPPKPMASSKSKDDNKLGKKSEAEEEAEKEKRRIEVDKRAWEAAHPEVAAEWRAEEEERLAMEQAQERLYAKRYEIHQAYKAGKVTAEEESELLIQAEDEYYNEPAVAARVAKKEAQRDAAYRAALGIDDLPWYRRIFSGWPFGRWGY